MVRSQLIAYSCGGSCGIGFPHRIPVSPHRWGTNNYDRTEAILRMQGGKAGSGRNSGRCGMKAMALVAMLVMADEAQAQQPSQQPSIVSANLCADQLVLSLADRDQIVSLSPFAADKEISFLAAQAAGLPRNTGAAEELIRLSADLVVLGRYDNRLTRDFLAAKRGRSLSLILGSVSTRPGARSLRWRHALATPTGARLWWRPLMKARAPSPPWLGKCRSAVSSSCTGAAMFCMLA